MPRQARLDYPGALHHVIGRGIDGVHIFKEAKDKIEFINRIKNKLVLSSFRIYAWCLMGNHFHLLIQTGETPLAEFMRSILTGYAQHYNKEHNRKGHLFQNRYKSILCEIDSYLFKLVSYVHLNPVKAGMVNLEQLKEYPWTGHKELVIKKEKEIIARDEVLGYFGRKEKQAVNNYLTFIRDNLETREDLMGGGLIRSLGGEKETKNVKVDGKQMYDERILGSGEFVTEVLSRIDHEEPDGSPFQDMEDLLKQLSRYYHIEKEEILNSRVKSVREARQVAIYLGNVYLGESLTTLGKLLNIKESAASQARKKGQQIAKEKGFLQRLSV